MKVVIFILLAIVGFISCKSREKGRDQASATKIQGASFLNVSFISKGAGINRAGMKDFLLLVSASKASKVLNTEPTSIPWGREGEMDFCFEIASFTSANYNTFKRNCEDLALTHSDIDVSEVLKCKEKRVDNGINY